MAMVSGMLCGECCMGRVKNAGNMQLKVAHIFVNIDLHANILSTDVNLLTDEGQVKKLHDLTFYVFSGLVEQHVIISDNFMWM